jgi:hypothetical protein
MSFPSPLNGWRAPEEFGRVRVPALRHTLPSAVLCDLPRTLRLAHVEGDDVLNQQGVGSCTAESVGSACLALAGRHGYPVELPSIRDLYARGRMRIGELARDSGCIIADVVEEAALGWIAEAQDPRPSAVFDEAWARLPGPRGFKPPRLINHAALAHDPTSIRWELACGSQIVVGCTLTEQWEFPTGAIDAPTGEGVGGHAFRIVGYDVMQDGTVYYFARNSWGVEWGNMMGEAVIHEDWLKLPWNGEIHALRGIRRLPA